LATKSKLEAAVEKQIEGLNDAQRELVKSQLSAYRRNDARLADIESELRAVNSSQAVTREAVRLKQSQRMALTYEHNQLTTANSKLASDLFTFLEERQ